MLTSLFPSLLLERFKRFGPVALVLVSALAWLPASPACGGIVATATSVVFTGSHATGLSARATFTVDPADGDRLRLLLENTTSGTTSAPAELLTSLYFNVLTGAVTGTSAPLTYEAAWGQVYLALRNKADEPKTYAPPPPKNGTVTAPAIPTPSNLRAFNTDDNTWQFRTGMSLLTSQPPLAFGVGTVGNNSLKPDNFNGNIVGGFDFGIYVGDVTTQNLNDTLLVKHAATFTFGGFRGYTLAQVSPHAVFGFGSAPEIVITVPEPATRWPAAVALLAALAFRGSPRSLLSACVASGGIIGFLLGLPAGR